jgi:hypothetical protein
MGLLILFGRIGDRVGLPIARAKTPNLPAKEAGTPVLGSPYPTTKASCQVLPAGLEKIPHILGIFLKYYSLYAIFDSSKNKFLSFTLIRQKQYLIKIQRVPVGFSN